VDGVRTVEKLDFGPVRYSHIGVKPPHKSILISDLIIRGDEIGVSSFHHERPWSDKVGELRIIYDVGKIKLVHVIFC
jgi:hypothetical protein